MNTSQNTFQYVLQICPAAMVIVHYNLSMQNALMSPWMTNTISIICSPPLEPKTKRVPPVISASSYSEKHQGKEAGTLYTNQALVKFALAGFSTTKNPRYNTAVQFFQLEQDNGKII
jgi:hypothetical protein